MREIDVLVSELYAGSFWLPRKIKIKKIEALKRLSEIGTPFTVKDVFPFVFDTNSKLAHEAAKTVHELMQKVKPDQWMQLYPSFQYVSLKLENLSELHEYPANIAVDLLGVASLNGDGYIRQKAIAMLSEYDTERKLPYIILRLGDWVPGIRGDALRYIEGTLVDKYVKGYITYVSIVKWLTLVRRVDLSEIYNKISSFLISSCSNMAELLHHHDRAVRLFSYESMLKNMPDNESVLKFGAKDRDVVIRRKIFNHILNHSYEVADYIRFFLNDSSPTMCCSAMMAIPEDEWVNFKPLVYENIFNQSCLVRETARYLLKKHGDEKFDIDYREKFRTNEVSCGFIYGLAETGSSEDSKFIEPYVGHRSSVIRVAVITSLFRLNREESLPYLISGLKDDSSKVRRRCVVLLCKCKMYDRSKVREVLKSGNSQIKISALRVLCHGAPWDALNDILDSLTDDCDYVRKSAWIMFENWYVKRSSRMWIKASHEDLLNIESTISKLDKKDIVVPDKMKDYWRGLPQLLAMARSMIEN